MVVTGGLHFSQSFDNYIQNTKMSGNSFSQAAKGALIVLGINVIFSLISAFILSTCCFSNSCSSQWNTPGLLCWISIIVLASISILQLIYVLPYGIWLRRRGRSEHLKGVITGAILTFLINGGCFIVILAR
jgi:hypothetical protein